MPSTVRRRRSAFLWVLIAFAFLVVLFKYVFHINSPYFYITYTFLFLLVTYLTFSEKAPQPPLGDVSTPPSTAPGQTVDVEMPAFDYRLYRDDVEDGTGAQCVICLSKYDEAEEPALSLPSCRHNFHVECIRRWLQSHGRCPVCSAAPFPPRPAPPARVEVVRVSVLVDPLR